MAHLTSLPLLLCVCLWTLVSGQKPSPCVLPPQFTARASQFDHEKLQIKRFFLAYDASNTRRVLIEELKVLTPGKQFFEFMELYDQNVIYEINLTKKKCIRITPRSAWRPYGIPANATFEDEYYVGGPGEGVFAQEWSDRISMVKREYWVGVFSLRNCYPIRETVIADMERLNSTIDTNFYDLVEGIPDPNIFIPPAYCKEAPWGKPTVKMPY